MTKTEFASQVAQKASITQAEAARVIDAVFNAESGAIANALDYNGNITIPGFGTFTRKKSLFDRLARHSGSVTFESADGSLTFLGPKQSAEQPDRDGDVDGVVFAGHYLVPMRPAAVDEIRRMALETWENADDAEEFLTTPHSLLGGQTPLAACASNAGAQRVREILLALEYGLPV